MKSNQGSEAAFTEALEKILSVSHAEIKKREAEYIADRKMEKEKRKPKTPAFVGRVSPGKG